MIAATAMLALLVLAPVGHGSEARYLFYLADEDEQNDLTLTKGPHAIFGSTWTWTDRGAPVTAAPPTCLPRDQHSAFCHPLQPTYVQECRLGIVLEGGRSFCPDAKIFLRDGDDRARIDPNTDFGWSLKAGRGDDDIAGAAVIDGGQGNDTIIGQDRRVPERSDHYLVGGQGRDRVKDNFGNDFIDAQDYTEVNVEPWFPPMPIRSPERDSVSCGPGDDEVVADRTDVLHADCEAVTLLDQRALLCPRDHFEWKTLRVQVTSGPTLSSTEIFRKRINRARSLAAETGCSIQVTHHDGKVRPKFRGTRVEYSDYPRSNPNVIRVDLDTDSRRVRYVRGVE